MVVTATISTGACSAAAPPPSCSTPPTTKANALPRPTPLASLRTPTPRCSSAAPTWTPSTTSFFLSVSMFSRSPTPPPTTCAASPSPTPTATTSPSKARFAYDSPPCSGSGPDSGRVPHTPVLRVQVLNSVRCSYPPRSKELRNFLQTADEQENFFLCNSKYPQDLSYP